jgi:hypothetical protein
MKALLLPVLVALVVLPSQLPASNTDSQGPVLQAESCRVELTGLGKEHWRGEFLYTGTADDDGHISRLTLPRLQANDPMASFVRLDQFESCISRWVFSGPGQYSVRFAVGTGGDALRQWSVTVSSMPSAATIRTLEQLRNPPAPRRFRLVFPRE